MSAFVSTDRFSRDLAMMTRRENRGQRRDQQMKKLYSRFDVSEVWFSGKLIGWMEKGKIFHCFKKGYKTESEAKLMLDLLQIRKQCRFAGDKLYKCPKCDLWHVTSKGHMAGTYK